MFGKSLMYGIDVYILHPSYQVKYHVVKKYDSSLDKRKLPNWQQNINTESCVTTIGQFLNLPSQYIRQGEHFNPPEPSFL